MCIDVDEKPFALELVAYIQEDSIFGASGRENFAQSLSDYTQQIYADPLTNAYNRRYYTEHYLTGEDNPAVAMIDVDHFKVINDTYGHMAGDAVLQRIVQKLKSTVRSTDYVIRYGGDEFLVIFGGDIPTDIFKDKLERFRRDVSEISMDKYPDLHPTISIGGIYSHNPDTDKIDEADHMLYEAKRQRNRVEIRIEA